MPDKRLPETQEELRDWLVEAWKDGWNSRRHLIGRPAGTVSHEKPKLLDAFLRSWDLPPLPKPVVDIRAAIRAITEER